MTMRKGRFGYPSKRVAPLLKLKLYARRCGFSALPNAEREKESTNVEIPIVFLRRRCPRAPPGAAAVIINDLFFRASRLIPSLAL